MVQYLFLNIRLAIDKDHMIHLYDKTWIREVGPTKFALLYQFLKSFTLSFGNYITTLISLKL